MCARVVEFVVVVCAVAWSSVGRDGHFANDRKEKRKRGDRQVEKKREAVAQNRTCREQPNSGGAP